MKIISFSLISFAFLISCSKAVDPNDKTKPTLEIISTIPVFTESMNEKTITIKVGESFTINTKLSDNSGLKQIKYDIHSASDSHTHARLEHTDWATSKIIDISGKESTQSQVFTSPSDTHPSKYHCEMIVIDQNGNESIEYVVSVVVN